MADDRREFYSSQMVRLELLSKPRFEKRSAEVRFYENHFAELVKSEPLSGELGDEAELLAARYGLAAADALQIAAAIRQGVQEFWTTEKPGKPVFRVAVTDRAAHWISLACDGKSASKVPALPVALNSP